VKADFYLLDLKKFIKDLLIDNNIIKINIFTVKFFLKTKIADFNNIKTIMEQKVLNISLIILVKKINKPIKSFLNKHFLKLNSILNKIFKVIVLIIIKDLKKIVSYCFASGIILKSLKEFIIIVLYKEKKKNYSLLSSYKLIAFKNTLAKVLEKYIINIIFEVVKKYKLLL